MTRVLAPLFLVAATASLALLGCGSGGEANPPAVPKTGADDGGHHHGDHHEMSEADEKKVEAALAKLPEADRKSAEQQHVCPVTGDMLGMMGTPIEVDVEGREVWICCPGCKDKLLAEPDKYLAKLDDAPHHD